MCPVSPLNSQVSAPDPTPQIPHHTQGHLYCRYHLTDVPSFVSGRHVVYFDPHCAFLPNISALNPGKRIDFVAARWALDCQVTWYVGVFSFPAET